MKELANEFDVRGTRIPKEKVKDMIVKLGDAEYLKVAGKVLLFQEYLKQNPDVSYSDKIEVLEDSETKVTVRVTYLLYTKQADGTERAREYSDMATEYRDQRGGNVNKKYALENAITSARGRALGSLGIGIELGSMESAERMKAALSEDEPASQKQVVLIKQLIAHLPNEKRAVFSMQLKDQYGTPDISEIKLAKTDAHDLIDSLKALGS